MAVKVIKYNDWYILLNKIMDVIPNKKKAGSNYGSRPA